MQNEKMVAEYLVQSLQDNLDDLEDKYNQLNREFKRNYRECDLLERNHERIKKEYQILQQTLKNKCELIENNGLTISNQIDQFKINNKLNNKFYLTNHHIDQLNNKIEDIKINGNHKELNLKINDQQQLNTQLNGHDLINNSINLSNHNQSNGFNYELINGFTNKQLTNGTHSINNHSSLNKDKRFTDQSSCSSLSSTNDKSSSASLIFSEELYQFLNYLEGKTLNEKINFLLHDKLNKIQKIKSLKSSLDDEKIRTIKLESLSLINGKQQLNGDVNRRTINNEDSKKTVDDYKKELELISKQTEQLRDVKSQIEKEINHLKTRLQTMEESENLLKTEKRKLLRQFRESQAKIEELGTENYHLQKRIDKLSKNSKISSNNFD